MVLLFISICEKVVHTCNLSYWGGYDWENHHLRPTWANSSQDPISKIIRAKWAGGMALSYKKQNKTKKHKKPSPTTTKKVKT
jgi:hypothetical protein